MQKLREVQHSNAFQRPNLNNQIDLTRAEDLTTTLLTFTPGAIIESLDSKANKLRKFDIFNTPTLFFLDESPASIKFG
jgi:hypothetical protein